MNTSTIIIIILAVFVLFVIFLYNSLIRLRNQVKNSWAQIDVQLKRRNDLIPNLVEAVKGYMKHEKGVLENVTKARTQFLKATSIEGKAKASNMLSETLKSLFAVSENYPNLKANENFMQLQEELSGTENKIAYSRQHYNDMVMFFNTKIEKFPNNIFANMLSFKQEQMFEATEAEKKNVKVQF
ncbi:MAG: LemA family protein [Nanoarchaeota archaeon]|nr:LemA family protein [Nanoarchaeota archaeon]MBU1270458.1 LemA family protein [Nanoarchaeota archaeon]MBU1605071.1 LemA family protein [Nanoarchaeota archaeon]MBU2443107.1 LemA family protein [Nanoarchaeota archaeon]